MNNGGLGGFAGLVVDKNRQNGLEILRQICIHFFTFIINILVLRTLKDLILNILLHGLALFLLNKYLPSWFGVESLQYSPVITFLVLAILFWIINNIIKVILKILTIPLKYMTFGLFSLVLNMFILYLFEYFVNNYLIGITISLGTFIQVFLISLYVAITSFIIKKIT
ncbi:MAG: phage holin family protein [Candidatus Absconditabacterales bacterium]|nr:phage holin family protein [Candidatus Absconditabacterales bacterium]